MGARIKTKKYFGLSLTFIAVLSFMVPVFSLGRVDDDISSIEPYNKKIGQISTTQIDLVVFRPTKSKPPMVGQFGDSLPTRNELEKEFPYKWHGTKILGVLPKGSRIKTVKVSREGKKDLNFVSFHSKILTSPNSSLLNTVIDTTLLTNMSDPPSYKPNLVEEIKQ